MLIITFRHGLKRKNIYYCRRLIRLFGSLVKLSTYSVMSFGSPHNDLFKAPCVVRTFTIFTLSPAPTLVCFRDTFLIVVPNKSRRFVFINQVDLESNEIKTKKEQENRHKIINISPSIKRTI